MERLSSDNISEESFTKAENSYFFLDLDSETPLYQQIRDQVILAMAEGRLNDGVSLPTTRQLALDFKINFHTVNKAYDLLRQEGFVSLTRKQGTFVRRSLTADSAWQQDWQNRLRILMAEAVAKGQTVPDILENCSSVLKTFPIVSSDRQNKA